MSSKINFTFVDINPEVSAAYAKFFGKEPNCKVKYGDIFEQGPGSIISPANTIGNMDGGIEKVISDRFTGLESRVLAFLRENFDGKLEIGNSQIIPTHDKNYPYIILTPTVLTPGTPSSTDNIFQSSLAAFRQIELFNRKMRAENKSTIDSVLIPGLGTHYGNVNPLMSAREVYKAFKLSYS